jgi:hypothetical protein
MVAGTMLWWAMQGFCVIFERGLNRPGFPEARFGVSRASG